MKEDIELVEVTIGHEGKPILGNNQDHYSIIDPDKTKGLDEFGNFTDKKKPTDKEIIVVFWSKRKNTIAILGIVSGIILASILLQETNILNLIFMPLFGLFAQLWGMIF